MKTKNRYQPGKYPPARYPRTVIYTVQIDIYSVSYVLFSVAEKTYF